MRCAVDDCMLPLFVPADRPERFAKALAAGADAIVIDLEDAIAASEKLSARAGLGSALNGLAPTAVPVLIRVNGAGSPWFEDDLATCAATPIDGIVLPKAETPETVRRVASATRKPVIALIETATGLEAAAEIAAVSSRVAFGSIDYAADMGCAHARDALLWARCRLSHGCRLAGKPAPIDGVTVAIHDGAAVEADARHAAQLGFSGKLLIHPAQVNPARLGFAPSPDELSWAKRILNAVGDGAAASVDAEMVDAPVVLRARQILRRHKSIDPGFQGEIPT